MLKGRIPAVFPFAIAVLAGAGSANAATLNLEGATTSGQIDSVNGLRFENVVSDPTNGSLDLIVRATDKFDTYDAANESRNGVSGEFGQINLRNNTLTSFEFLIVASGGTINDIVAPESLTISFLDLDGVNNPLPVAADAPPEQGGFETITVATPSAAISGSAVDINTDVAGQTTFSGTFGAGGGHNPSSSLLTAEQSSIALSVTFENQGVLEFAFGSGTGASANSGRNILFGGEVTFSESATVVQTSTEGVPEGGVVPGMALAGMIFGGMKLRQRRQNKVAIARDN